MTHLGIKTLLEDRYLKLQVAQFARNPIKHKYNGQGTQKPSKQERFVLLRLWSTISRKILSPIQKRYVHLFRYRSVRAYAMRRFGQQPSCAHWARSATCQDSSLAFVVKRFLQSRNARLLQSQAANFFLLPSHYSWLLGYVLRLSCAIQL